MEKIEIGDRVSWFETYRTAGNVIAQTQIWGQVLRIFDHPGDRDGFSIKGTYLATTRGNGDLSYILIDHIHLVDKN